MNCDAWMLEAGLPYTDPYFLEFLSYWKGLAAEAGGVPMRAQFVPWEIPKSLPYIFMIDRTSDDQFGMRLTGSGLHFSTSDSFEPGSDLAHFDKIAQADYLQYFDTLFGPPCGCWSERVYVAPEGATLVGSAISVPLFDDKKNAQIALGMMKLQTLKADAEKYPAKGHGYSRLNFVEYFDVGFGTPE